MLKQEVDSKIREMIIANKQFGEEVKLDCDLRDNYGIDSIALVTLLIEIESEFDITIDSSLLTYDCFSTGEAISTYVFDKLR